MSKKTFTRGRNNLSVTVFVPWDCDNNCSFCTSKKEYENVKTDFILMQSILNDINRSTIQEVVITGGEPSRNTKSLEIMLGLLKNKKVYINTTLPLYSDNEFIYLVNKTENVCGINISRHEIGFNDESLYNISPDLYLGFIKKPIHINVVSPKAENLCLIIDRYREIAQLRKSCGFGDTTICIREDFTKTTKETLHSTNDTMLNAIGFYEYKLVSYTFCNVCDTHTFEVEDGLYLTYHKGLEHTSIEEDGKIEVNDIVVFPDGELCYDWDRSKKCDKNIFDIQSNYPSNNVLERLQPHPTTPMNPYYVNIPQTFCNCNDSYHKICGSKSCWCGGC